MHRLRAFLSREIEGWVWRVVIADNGSTDSTPDVGRRLSDTLKDVGYLRLEQCGRGRALKAAWGASKADAVAYMDVDLSTDLSALPALAGALAAGRCDVAIGSRLCPGARVTGRSLKREIISRAYNLLIRAMFLVKFRDAQCGFKAVSRRAADSILPLIEDNGWFFDTEMLLVAEKAGYVIEEAPVSWADDPDTRVRILSTAWVDFKGLMRMRFGGLRCAVRALRRSQQESG